MKICQLILSLLLITASHSYAGSLPDAPHIVVSGTHQLKVSPDILTMSLEIIEVAKDAQEASQKVEKRSSTLIKTAKEIGINKKDINSSSLTMNPRYDWNNRQQVYTGTEVSRKITLTLRDLSKYDSLIQAVLKSSVARINSTTLSSSKKDELLAKSLKLAVADATQTANLLMAGLTQKVGSIYSISTVGDTSPRLMNMEYNSVRSQAKTSSFEPGEISYSKSVQIVFYLVDAQ